MSESLRVLRAVLSNQLARFAPSIYLRATRQTGRGAGDDESPGAVAEYFRRSVDDYLGFANVPDADRAGYFEGKSILEYGPGDFPGVAVVLVALGARKVWCVDRFPMVRLSERSVRVLEALLDGLDAVQRERVKAALRDPDAPAEGFRPEVIEYVVRPHGFSQLDEQADLVISRAVLEHVDDLPGTFADMRRAMRPGAQAWHQVDLRSHGLHRRNPLDFLAWSPAMWSAMHSHKGVPNRWRIDRYREIVAGLAVDGVRFEPTHRAAADDVRAVRASLSEPFRRLSDEDLSWLGFWVSFRKPLR